MKSFTHFDLAVFLLGLLGLTLMVYGIIIETSPYRAEFGPYYSNLAPTGIVIHVLAIVYFIIKGTRKSQED